VNQLVAPLSRIASPRWSVVLLALLALAGAEQTLASRDIVARFTTLSWDNPATLLQDETASQGVISVESARQTSAGALALGPVRRLTVGPSSTGAPAVAALARQPRGP